MNLSTQILKDINVKQVIAEIVEEKLKELIGDPDTELELKSEVKSRLIKSFNNEKKGGKKFSAKRVAAQLGLKYNV